MIVTGRNFSLICLTSSLPVKKCSTRFGIILAKKRGLQDNGRTQQQPIFPLGVSKSILVRTAIAVFGLGFIDAGYSGDWSRIGVINPETEELLKVAAFLVVPLCLFLIFSLPKEPNS